MRRVLLLSVMLLLIATAGVAQESGGTIVVQTFKFNFKTAERASAIIRPLMSSDGTVSIQPGSNTLVVSDFGDNVERIATALDIFDAPSRSFKLEIRLVAAGREQGRTPEVPEALRDIATKLSGVLRFNSFEELGTLTFSGKEGDEIRSDLGPVYHADFLIGEFDPVSETVQLSNFKLSRYDSASKSEKRERVEVLKTTLNLKVGQTVVLGASRLPDSSRALMLIVVARQ